MKTNLIIGEMAVQEIQRYAALHSLKFYEACNRLLKLGIGYSLLMGETRVCHHGPWDYSKGISICSQCGLRRDEQGRDLPSLD